MDKVLQLKVTGFWRKRAEVIDGARVVGSFRTRRLLSSDALAQIDNATYTFRVDGVLRNVVKIAKDDQAVGELAIKMPGLTGDLQIGGRSYTYKMIPDIAASGLIKPMQYQWLDASGQELALIQLHNGVFTLNSVSGQANITSIGQADQQTVLLVLLAIYLTQVQSTAN